MLAGLCSFLMGPHFSIRMNANLDAFICEILFGHAVYINASTITCECMFTSITASLAANAKMSAHETVPQHAPSTACFASIIV